MCENHLTERNMQEMATISKKMLINVVHPEEARVAIVHDGRLMELNVEITGKEQIKGNIYKGVVLRVEPGLQAAFVDIGRGKPGFLQMGELHPDFWQWRDDVPEEQQKRRPRIQEVLRRGQELLVQVEKDERDNKGSALTTYLSLPGRYMVTMPGSDSAGISRKVEQDGVRRQLKETVAAMNIPEGIGYIIRTEAVGRSQEELQKDLDSLVGMYNGIKESAAEIKGAGEIYRDSGLIIRFIRDYFSDDIDEVLVDSKDSYREAKEFFRANMPKCEKLVKLHKEKRPIFSRFQLEEQIDQIYEKRVPLPSGGSLIIEPTEALVSIDVNSGKTSGERGVEDTAFKTNMEAAEEVARQLRLRDLGGLIVIDFIDMRDRKHNHDVEKTLKQALKMDKARVNLGRISDFGILEMSRQRIAKTLNDAIHLACPHCEGRGKVKSVEAMAVSFLRKVHAAAAKGNVSEVHGGLPLEVAYYLLNRKKRELIQIENDYEIAVTVKGKTSFLLNQLELETVKREKQVVEELILQDVKTEKNIEQVIKQEITTEVQMIEEHQPVEIAPAEGVKKKKRRRKKKKTVEESVITTEHPVLEQEESVLANEPDQPEKPVVADTESQENLETLLKPKKKRRRRGRKGNKSGEILPVSSGQDAVAENNEVEVQVIAPVDTLEVVPGPGVLQVDESASVPVKPKRTRAPRKKKEPILPIAEHVVVLERVQETDTGNERDITPEIVVETASEAVTKSKRRPRKKSAKKEVEITPQQQPQSLPIPEASQAAETKKPVKKVSRPRRKKPEEA